VVNGLFINFVLTEAFKIPLKSIEAVAKSMAVGDLSQNLGGESCREVNIVYYELNNAIIGLKKFIARINEQSDLLHNASEQLRTTSEKNIESSSQVISAIQEMAKGTAEQAEHLSKASENVSE
jgi:methyl-accepting chemotaxis protein